MKLLLFNISFEITHDIDDVRILENRPLVPPQILFEDIPLESPAIDVVRMGRTQAAKILNGGDDRLIVVVGPCSIHDVDSALEYANLIKPAIQKYAADLLIVMRVYFEKPRTTIGWKV